MIQQGKHVARAKSAEMGRSAKAGTPFVRVYFEILEGPDQGKEIAWNGYFTGDAFDRSLESLENCGCRLPESFARYEELYADGLGSRDVSITVEHEPYQDGSGKVAAKVAWVNRLGASRIKDEHKLSGAAQGQFKAEMMAAIARRRAEAKAAAAGPSRPAPQQRSKQTAPASAPVDEGVPTNNDDIPF